MAQAGGAAMAAEQRVEAAAEAAAGKRAEATRAEVSEITQESLVSPEFRFLFFSVFSFM
jgi:hypothetical protein